MFVVDTCGCAWSGREPNNGLGAAGVMDGVRTTAGEKEFN